MRTVFAKYATFDGRATRPEFWWWTLFNAIIVAAFYLLVIVLSIGTAFAGYSRYPMGPTAFLGLIWVVLVLWGVAVIVPNLAVTVRRLRDAGFHWGFIFLALVPFGGIAVLVMCAQPSRYP
ncbi:DUF805 domain-containing protein [Microbacterium elymi]|uniref:DUF805 domain-containing protein n=1 Tax=Microbacterium elymi TaxID=2909587 RepID=A0ABY5NJF7_9MICO|nr:DUF805 domain-containing protein [Microbacterium elymi]UUT35307.1 DUF805 domain-containing protein [Microbacterium elymi]